MSAEPNLGTKPRITRLHLAGIGGVTLAVIAATAFQMRGSASPEQAPDGSEVKACCVAPPVSRTKAFTSAPPSKTAPEHTPPHD